MGGCAPGPKQLTVEEENAEYESMRQHEAEQRIKRNLEKRRKKMKIQTRPEDKTGIFDLNGLSRGEALKVVNFYYDQQAQAVTKQYVEMMKHNNLCQEIIDPYIGVTGHSGEMLEAGISAPYPPLHFKTREEVSAFMHSDHFSNYEVKAPKEENFPEVKAIDWSKLSETFQQSMTRSEWTYQCNDTYYGSYTPENNWYTSSVGPRHDRKVDDDFFKELAAEKAAKEKEISATDYMKNKIAQQRLDDEAHDRFVTQCKLRLKPISYDDILKSMSNIYPME
jgi:hypothetical protein